MVLTNRNPVWFGGFYLLKQDFKSSLGFLGAFAPTPQYPVEYHTLGLVGHATPNTTGTSNWLLGVNAVAIDTQPITYARGEIKFNRHK